MLASTCPSSPSITPRRSPMNCEVLIAIWFLSRIQFSLYTSMSVLSMSSAFFGEVASVVSVITVPSLLSSSATSFVERASARSSMFCLLYVIFSPIKSSRAVLVPWTVICPIGVITTFPILPFTSLSYSTLPSSVYILKSYKVNECSSLSLITKENGYLDCLRIITSTGDVP